MDKRPKIRKAKRLYLQVVEQHLPMLSPCFVPQSISDQTDASIHNVLATH
jgi:hypothetical protein